MQNKLLINRICEKYFSKFHTKTSFLTAVFVSIILLVAFLLRIYNLGDLSLWWDELLTGTYVTQILEIGIPVSPSGFEYYWRGIAYHYVVSIFAFLFGTDEFWLRFPSVLFGVGIIAVSYRMAKRIDPQIAILTALILCFSTYNIEYSQFARFYAMNAFLFMINIEFFWLGYYQNLRFYKILSPLIFILMLLTVQLGGLFLAVVAFFAIERTTNYVLNRKNHIDFYIKNLIIVACIFLAIYIVNNPLDLLGIYAPNPYDMQSQVETDGGVKYLIPGIPIPQWSNVLIPFFSTYYFPSIFAIFGVLYTIFSFVQRKTYLDINLNYKYYFFGTVLVSYLLFELANPFQNEPRLFFVFEPLFIISTLYGFLLVVRRLQPYVARLSLILLAILMILVPSPLFSERLTKGYGDDVSDDPFRSTWAQSHRSDVKSISQYLNSNINSNDIWINTMEPAYGYTKRNPEYMLNQNYQWRSMWREEIFTDESGNYIDIRYGAILINSAEEMANIIALNPGRNVWITVSGANLKTLYTTHLRDDTRAFIAKHADKIVYVGPDSTSLVLLFRKSI